MPVATPTVPAGASSPTIALTPVATASSPGRAALGARREAVLVRLVGDDVIRPDAFEVTAFDPVTDASRPIATIPGPVLPPDGWLDVAQGVPVVSRGGYLAIPFARGPDADTEYPSLAVVDLRSPTTAPVFLDRYRLPRWGPTDELIVERTDASSVDVVSIDRRSVRSIETGATSAIVAWSTEATTPFVATHDERWGSVDLEGTFRPATDLAPIYQRTGRERPTGVSLHTLGMACDSGPVGECVLVESASSEQPLAVWHREQEPIRLVDHLWAVDGRTVIMLLVAEATEERLSVTLVHATAPDTRVTVTTLEVPGWVIPAILGISSERDAGHPASLVIGDAQGGALTFVLDDGTTRTVSGWWFAGWADDPEPYDPD
jgi:hypothetical protein